MRGLVLALVVVFAGGCNLIFGDRRSDPADLSAAVPDLSGTGDLGSPDLAKPPITCRLTGTPTTLDATNLQNG